MELRSAAKRRRQQQEQAAQTLASAKKAFHDRLRSVSMHFNVVQNQASMRSTWKDFQKTSPAHCDDHLPGEILKTFRDLRELETLVTTDATHAQAKTHVLTGIAQRRLSAFAILRTMLPLYSRFLAETNFKEDSTNATLRRVVSARDTFQGINMDDAPDVLALRTDFVDALKPLYARLGAFKSSCVHAETLESCPPPNAHMLTDLANMLIPKYAHHMAHKTMLVPSADDNVGRCVNKMRVMRLRGLHYEWFVHVYRSLEWGFNYKWSSLCAAVPKYQFQLSWATYDYKTAQVLQYNQAADTFVHIGTINVQ